jgi:hypothetical protein
MTVREAVAILQGDGEIPEDVTVEQVFAAAHFTPHPVTPY